MLTCVEICAGAGGQALGLAMAGFVHVALVEYEKEYCDILKENRPEWPIICADVHDFDGKPYHGVDLFAGGVPCPPFSVAGKQLGADDERDLFPEALRLVREIEPRASCWRTYVDSLTRHSANTANTYCVPSPTWDTTCRSSSCKRPTTASHNCGRGLSLSASAMTSQAVSHFHIQRLILNRHRQSARSCKTSWQKLAGKVPGNGQNRQTRLHLPSSEVPRSMAVRTWGLHVPVVPGQRCRSKARASRTRHLILNLPACHG